MADILLDEQGTPTTPSAGQMVLYPDSSASVFVQRNDAGIVQGDAVRAAVAVQTGFAADTYLVNSGLILPAVSMQAGTVFEWTFVATKTAAGIAAPIFQVRVGPNQSTADTSRLSITTSAQSAVVDLAIIKILVTCRSVSSVGVIQGVVWIQHNLAATGFATVGPAGLNIVEGTSAGFDNTALGGQFVGLSINGGTSAAWTINQVAGLVFYG
jgi:hypothetical protein